jgi:hypothetical protein
MKNLINCLVNNCAFCSWFVSKWKSFVKRKYLFLITLGTILSAVFFGLNEWINEWILNKYNPEIYIKINNDNPIIINTIPLEWKLIIIAILSIFFTYLIDKIRHHFRTKKHFHYSHPIVTKRIIEIYSGKSKLNNYLGTNKDIDRVIKSPLEYVAETLGGNLAPYFKPDHHAFNEIYYDEIKLIVAVTAENPNLWLDPTICFHLINCCAVSLLKKKGNGTRDLEIRSFRDSLIYRDYIQEQLNTLDCLTTQTWNWGNDLANFDFFRFFLYDEQQRACLVNTVFPSLKASHDLFQMKSYFNPTSAIRQRLNTMNKLNDFDAHINFLWDEISMQNLSDDFQKIINKRKNEHMPEFLFLFKSTENSDIHSVTVHTFVDGIPYSVEYRESDIGNNGYQKVQELITYIAQSVHDIGIIGQYIPAGRYLNTEKSYLRWV